MATITDFCKILFSAYSESFDPSVLVTEMERGMPTQRVQNTQVVMKLNASLLFRSSEDITGFENWYFDEIKRIGFFPMQHPRTGLTISVRFEKGSIGVLTPQAPGFWLAQRDVVLEYLR